MQQTTKKRTRRIPYAEDRRRRLTTSDRLSIVRLHASGKAIRYLARRFQVSRRLIQFIVYPERRERAQVAFKARQSDGRYYIRERHRIYMRRYRAHLRSVRTARTAP